jgi:hypothetical protein
VRDSFDWATRAQTFLTLAAQRGASRLQLLRRDGTFGEGPATVTTPWDELRMDEQAVLVELFELASVTMSVLPLPVIATPDPGQSADDVAKLERTSREWNDAVLNRALALFAL